MIKELFQQLELSDPKDVCVKLLTWKKVLTSNFTSNVLAVSEEILINNGSPHSPSREQYYKEFYLTFTRTVPCFGFLCSV